MPDIKIKGYSGVELPFADVPKVWLAAPESTADNPILEPYTYGEALEGVEVEPDFSGGDMQVTVPEGYLLRSGVVKKPENLIPGNIKKGETVAGIPGEYEGETVELEEVTVDLAMANGDQVIEPTEGKALGKVTLTKPETLVPENIAEGVDIGGVIGALVAGGAKIAYGTITQDYSTNHTINHGLGVVPDFVIVAAQGTTFFMGSVLLFSFGVSSKLFDVCNIPNTEISINSSGVKQIARYSKGIDVNNTSFAISNATTESFIIRTNSSMKLCAETIWLAIGGLT